MSNKVTMDDSNLTERGCIEMLNTFRWRDLKTLLKGFARITYKKKYKTKEELKSCAFKCLTKIGFKSEIWKIYRDINTKKSCSTDLLRVTDRIEFNDVSSNINYKNLFTEFPYPIKFKRLPFYEDISEIIKPTVLSKNKEEVEFALSLEQVNLVAANGSSENNKNNYEFHVRICKLENASLNEILLDDTPPGVIIHFNTGQHIYHQASKTHIDCTDYIPVTQGIQNITIIKNTIRQYVFKMDIVKKISVDNLTT